LREKTPKEKHMDTIHWTERFRNVVGIVRDVGLIAILLGLLIFPATVQAQLSRAGIVRGSIFGIDFETQVRESKQQSEEALKETKSAQKELGQAVSALESANRKIAELEVRNPQLVTETAPLREQLESSGTTAAAAKESIDSTVTKQQAIVVNQSALLRQVQQYTVKN
jgi:hypothetical protein